MPVEFGYSTTKAVAVESVAAFSQLPKILA
jgi:hypothetical protein